MDFKCKDCGGTNIVLQNGSPNSNEISKREISREEWIHRYWCVAWSVSFTRKDEKPDAIKAYAKWDGVSTPEACGYAAIAAQKAKREQWEKDNEHRERPRKYYM